jgi:hypothetical protein
MDRDREALEAALARLARGDDLTEATTDPVLRARLEPLLGAAAAVHQLSEVRPSPEASHRIRTALRQAASRSTQPAARYFSWRRPAVALAFAVALATLGTTSVLASSQVLPDSPLYTVRTIEEGAQVQLAGSTAQRATLHANFATARSDQLRQLGRSHERLSSDALAVTLRDIRDLMQQANQEAHADRSAAPAVNQAESQVGQQLTDVQQQGTYSAAENQAIGATIQAVQAGQQGQSGTSADTTTNTGGTGTNQP